MSSISGFLPHHRCRIKDLCPAAAPSAWAQRRRDRPQSRLGATQDARRCLPVAACAWSSPALTGLTETDQSSARRQDRRRIYHRSSRKFLCASPVTQGRNADGKTLLPSTNGARTDGDSSPVRVQAHRDQLGWSRGPGRTIAVSNTRLFIRNGKGCDNSRVHRNHDTS